jgi:DNA invertase Pin-like site-specific DNA recombinase
MRVVIYARVSADDKGHDPENQLRELRDWIVNSSHIISREYVDYESGLKGAEKRKQFAALFDDAAKRKFDCVLFWALDRFSREGMAQTIIHLQRLSSYGRPADLDALCPSSRHASSSPFADLLRDRRTAS